MDNIIIRRKVMKELVDILKHTRQHLMNGVSYMIPVVVSGGILFAIAAIISMNSVQTSASVSSEGIAGFLSNVGGVGLGLMVPVLSAFIASSIADRPGIAPGIIGGQLAVNVGAGFIGGIVTGLVAGIAAYYLKKIPLPKSIQSLKAIFIVPLLATLITGFIIVVVVGNPCASLLQFLETWLGGMTGSGAVLVGAITGAMIAFDLGGPLNKVAYSTGAALVGTTVAAGGKCTFMGPIGLAICIPPIGAGLASLLLKNKFSNEERDAGIGAIAMGCCGITEGAISYTTADPVRMIPINMISCAIAGAIAGGLGVWDNAAWGGLVVLPVTSIGKYLICTIIGVAIYVVLCAIFKKDYVEKEEEIGDVDISFE
jgi:fructose-specific phosphotransferase system IIC component